MELTLHPAIRSHTSGMWFPLDHPYVERCWPSLIGPSGVLFLRRAARLFVEFPEVTVSIDDLALDLGVGVGAPGGMGRVHRTIRRLARLDFVRLLGPSDVEVFTDVPPLPPSYLRRMSDTFRVEHDQLIATRSIELARTTGRSW